MTVFAFGFVIVITAFVAAMFLVMPAMVRRTLPLGVSVPQSHVNDPVVRSSIRTYRSGIVAAWVVSVLVSALASPVSPQLVLAVMPLLFIALSGAVYVVTRRSITAAKREGAWYEGATTRLVADASPRRVGHPSVAWLVASVLVVWVTIAIGVAVYPSLPAVIPVHWGGAGQVNGTAPKSVWSVFGVPLITLGVIALFYGMSWLTLVTPPRSVASDTPEQAARRAGAQRHLASAGLGIMSLVLSIGLGLTTIAGWLAPDSGAVMTAALLTTLVLVLAAVAVILVRYYRSMSASRAAGTQTASRSGQDGLEHERPDAPDDDRYWKFGAVYINRDDPATFVPKRFGVGWTVNLGSPGGIVFAVVIVLIILGALVTAVVVPGLR